MGRTPRIYIDNGCYHIITRGNQKQDVFKCGEDFNVYLAILKKAKRKHNILLYAYCLMPNHAHLLIEPQIARSISAFMHLVNRAYVEYFNIKYDKVGHLWQSRFKSKPIIKGEYLINCANYIEANPVRAEIVDDITKYEWSSYVERCLSSKRILLDEIGLGTLAISNSGTG